MHWVKTVNLNIKACAEISYIYIKVHWTEEALSAAMNVSEGQAAFTFT